ncbi:MAG: UDP-N-acetylmuramoylalanine--D-glutamate ligase [Omnitrophica bacterium RBG_13_46_9]|nr:MAG: UDP-N-acetylmuramoylalanine--D-glutamate ligase [Omnitrophica bacterium RBG_13_46_9]
MDLRNKKVTVVGLGDSGIKSALLLCEQGAIVGVTDNGDNENIRRNAGLLREKCIDAEIGQHTESFLSMTELLVLSPGVENSSLPVRYAQKNNIPMISEMELGYSFCKGLIVAVTGTNGKSTVVSLLGEILRQAKIPVNVCGNIGNALSGEVSALAKEVSGSCGKNIDKDTVVILETSSFQLERIVSFKPYISVILNVTEDHLDRYSDFDGYFAAKKRIFENQRQRDVVILNYDDENLRRMAGSQKIQAPLLYFSSREKVRGAYFDKGDIKIFLGDAPSHVGPRGYRESAKSLFKLRDFRLTQPLRDGGGIKGGYNIENILASVLVAALLGVKEGDMEKALTDFMPLKHRFEKVATVDGIDFIDDSKATNIDSTYRALELLDRPAILIAGGKDKNIDYGKVLPAIRGSVKKLILIGETRNKMRDIFKDFVETEEKDSLEEAVLAAYKSASPGDYVLLSPMCSSFDMFRDYRHRGDVFRMAVENLKSKTVGHRLKTAD